MDNGDATQGHAMTPEEFAKLMGAYPQPAENPLPAYGGYMDNSPANFSFVEFNDYFGAETHEDDTFICQRSGKTEHMDNGFLVPNLGMVSEDHMTKEDWRAWDKHNARVNPDSYSQEQLKELGLVKEAPYAGAGSLFGIKQDTGLEGFTTSELTTSSAIHGDFDEASLNYSGHQNFEVRAEEGEELEYPCDVCGKPAAYNFQDATIRWDIADDEFVGGSPKISEYGGDNQNDFYCKEHGEKYEGIDPVATRYLSLSL